MVEFYEKVFSKSYFLRGLTVIKYFQTNVTSEWTSNFSLKDYDQTVLTL